MSVSKVALAVDHTIKGYGKKVAIDQAVRIALDTFSSLHEVQLSYFYSSGGVNFKDALGSLYFVSPPEDFCKEFEKGLKDKELISKITFLPGNAVIQPPSILTKKYTEAKM